MAIVSKVLSSGEYQHPEFIPDSIIYETKSGSISYGVANDNSDIDAIGVSIPPLRYIFPHLNGEIRGFGKKVDRFKQFQVHGHIMNSNEYDISVYSIVRFFHLAMDNNPNMIELLFTPDECVTVKTSIADLIRDNRRMFPHKGSYFRFKGFAGSQINKMKNSTKSIRRRLKYAYHAVRLLCEAEQILLSGDLVLNDNIEILASIRSGDWTLSECEGFFIDKERG